MNKNALRKDFFVEIRRSLGRYLSIFFIVALGVSLFVGLRATEPDMILSGDAYTDENKLMDIKIVSTYGLTQEDKDVIEKLPTIELAEGSYSVDVLCEAGENQKVIHVMATTEQMNKVTVVEGRLPGNEKECLIDQDFLEASEYEIGDTITFISGTDAKITETLKEESFKIVGSGNSPLYFSTDKGSATIGNGSVSGFAIVQPKAFSLDVFTELYIQVDGARELRSFTDEYDEVVEEAIQQIELIQNVRCEVRRDDLAEEAQLQIDKARSELNTKKEEAEKEITKNEEKLEEAELDIKIAKLQIESGKAQLESGRAELEAGKQELKQTKAYYKEALELLDAEKKSLEEKIAEAKALVEGVDEELKAPALEAIAMMEESVVNLNGEIETLRKEAEAEFAAGEKKIADAEALLTAKEQEIAKAEKELLKGEKEIHSGKGELKNAREEMESQIADGAEEIDEAESEISKIELPVWYIFDRTSIPEYKGFGDNAARIAALAIVFPTMFFLVAALISLTTMTRMVEEQRVQIGTMKALGYSSFDIMKKYLNYALTATIGGSVFGTLIGEKLFPYVIIISYKIVYIHIPQILVPYHLKYVLMATVLAALCTGAATIFACYKELRAQPAILMRPEAPKIGKRTLIEKIPFLWKHLNFTWKSSLRNMFRYKKRFFMTLFGIGGCMGLLMVGFGLRDSIKSIAALQYGELHLYDSSIFISEDMQEETRTALMNYFEDKNEISAYMNAHMSNMTLEHEEEKLDAYVTAIEQDELSNLSDFFVYRSRTSHEKYELSSDGVILSEKTAKMLGAEVGDAIYLTGEGKSECKAKITAICENYAGHYMYMTSDYYEELYGEKAFNNTIFINVRKGLPFEKLQQLGEEILEYDDILNVQYTEILSGQMDGMLSALDRVMGLLIAVAGMLSFVVMYNLNNINITERRRELATLKVLGFYDGEVATYVYRENILLTLLGTLVGCGAGKLLHLFTITTVEVDNAMFGREIYPMSYLYGAFFTICFSVFVNWIMYYKLKKINMVESLKSVE